jgi:protein translocase SecG subunit
MYTVALILTVIVAILLALVVLAQAAKGQGLAGGLAAPGGIGTVFGVRRATDFLAKATLWLAGILATLVLLMNLVLVPGSSQGPSVVRQGPAPTAAPVQPQPQSSSPIVPQQSAPQTAPQGTPQQAPAPAPAR